MNTVLNISEAASIAIHSLALIGSANGRLNVLQMAEVTHFSRHHIAKILLLLSKKGYVTSGRGPRGGYTLKKDAAEITMLEIYELIDGPMEYGHCSIHDETCPFSECVFGEMREKAVTEFREYLENHTIEYIIKTKYIKNEAENCKN